MSKRTAKKTANTETYTDYLRRVGRGHAESGMEFTAEDYFASADRIDAVEAELRDALAELKVLKNGGR